MTIKETSASVATSAALGSAGTGAGAAGAGGGVVSEAVSRFDGCANAPPFDFGFPNVRAGTTRRLSCFGTRRAGTSCAWC